MTASDPVLEARGLTKSYGSPAARVPVFEGIDLSLDAGSIAAVVGPSGCGKSTLLHLLGLLEAPDAGSIRLADSLYSSLDEEKGARLRARSIGFVFQFDHLLPELTLVENVMVPLRLGGKPRSHSRDAAMEMLVQVELADLAERFPKELSGGQRQRGAVARALVHDPVLLLADEPTGNLDRASAGMVFELFLALARRPGRVAILVTHDPELANGCDKIFSLDRTALVERKAA